MSRAVRPRPVDIYKSIPIHYGFMDDKELKYEDENGFMRTVTQTDDGRGATETVVATKTEEIVVQTAVIVPNWQELHPPEKYKRTGAFVKQKKSVDANVEYVVEEDDMEWISKYNKEKKGPEMNYDMFEQIIDVLERAAKGSTLELATAEKLSYGKLKLQQQTIKDVYAFWNLKRGKLSNSFAKALLLRYRTLKNNEDPDPNVVFRPREKEHQTRRKTRKNDKNTFKKMVELRLNFERTRNILELMKQREKIKQERIQLMRSAFEVQLQMLQKQAEEDPTAEREIHSQFLIEEERPMPRQHIQQHHQQYHHQQHHHQQHHQQQPERQQRMRQAPQPHYNAYERSFTSNRSRRGRHDVDDLDEREYVPRQREPAHEPERRREDHRKSHKPAKKRVTLAGHAAKALEEEELAAERPSPPMRIIRPHTRDVVPIDMHQVHDSGKWADPIREPDRDWNTFRYTARGRIGRGGRIIFDRTMVRDKIPTEPKCGVEAMDWGVISSRSLQIWKGESEAAYIMRQSQKRTWDMMNEGVAEMGTQPVLAMLPAAKIPVPVSAEEASNTVTAATPADAADAAAPAADTAVAAS